MEPTLIEISGDAPIVKEELFVPIMHIIKIKDLQDAIRVNNSVPQGLSSSLFTKNLSHLFEWVGPSGSDCGIVNVNIGPSGAEIGGKFCSINFNRSLRRRERDWRRQRGRK